MRGVEQQSILNGKAPSGEAAALFVSPRQAEDRADAAMIRNTVNADERAIGPLITFLRGRDTEMRRTAALALGQIDDPRAVEALIEAVRDYDAEVRRYAAESLGRSASPAAVAALVKALADQAGGVRGAARMALERIGEPAVLPLLTALRDDRLPASTRHSAAAALGRIADPRAIAPLLNVLRGYVSYGALHRSASAALGEIALRHPVPELREALPLLRGLAPWTEMHQETMRRIEAATAGSRHLPIPAAPPLASPQDLPIPAAPPSPPSGTLPIPASGPHEEVGGRQSVLSRLLRGWRKQA